MELVQISACVCRGPSLTPKTQPNGSLVLFGWVFGGQHDPLEKSVSPKAEKKLEFISFIFDYVVFGQLLRKKHEQKKLYKLADGHKGRKVVVILEKY